MNERFHGLARMLKLVVSNPVLLLAALVGGTGSIDPRLGEWLALGVIFFAGIPHGAFDLRAAQIAWGARGHSIYAIVLFYLAVGAAMSALCLLAPPFGLALFLLISIAHFAEGEAESLGVGEGVCVAIGAILMPIGGHLDEAARYLTFFVSSGVVDSMAPYLRFAARVCGVLVGLVALRRISKGDLMQGGEVLVCLAAWFLLPPLAGFAVWFVGRHGRHHVARCREVFAGGPRLMSLDTVLISVVAFTLVVPLGIRFDLGVLEDLFAAAIILIAGLTLPHMVVTHALARSIRPDTSLHRSHSNL